MVINADRQHSSGEDPFVAVGRRGGERESFVIAKAGKPMALVTRLDSCEPKPKRRLGFLQGKIVVPDDFKTKFRDEIEEMFSGKE
jgi:hypothetical protein